MVGIDAQNINTFDNKFICHICSLILRHPLQINSCGHRFCQSCLHIHNQASINCPQCQTPTTADQIMIDRGFDHDMQVLPIICSLCQWKGTLSTYQDHLQQTHPHQQCIHCHQQFSLFDQLNEHISTQCQQITCECVLKDFGCRHQIVRHEMLHHYRSEEHQQSLMNVVEQIKLQLVESQMWRNRRDNEDDANALVELEETLNILASGVRALREESAQHNSGTVEHETNTSSLVANMSKVRSLIEEQNSLFERTKQNCTILKEAITSLEEGLDDLQHVSYDGTYTWKIKNVREKINDAQSERQTSIYSPPFYSSPTGYKMRARLYLHGDGNARRTHMSLFFVLMRGPNDAVLKFPFNYKVTFCLYDQTPQQRHIIDSFRPDIKSNSFQRPRSEMNIASGIPKFCPLVMIQQEGNPYVRDDTMFIKVMVDFGDMPETLLPYTFSLNPGLPMHVYQTKVREQIQLLADIERRQQEVLREGKAIPRSIWA